MHNQLLIEIAPGELYDRLSIIGLKIHHCQTAEKREALEGQAAYLRELWYSLKPGLEAVRLSRQLADVNSFLWRIEDDIRACEKRGEFGEFFITLARKVYQTNDQRAELKRQINQTMEVAAPEEDKVYA